MKRIIAAIGFVLLSAAPLIASIGIDGVGSTGSCPATGKVLIKPPLIYGGSTPGAFKIKSKIPKFGVCSGLRSNDGAHVISVKAKGYGTTPDSDCLGTLGTTPAPATVTVKWKTDNKTKLNASTVAFATRTGGVSGGGAITFDYDGTVTAGSFTGEPVTVHVEMDQDIGTFLAACDTSSGGRGVSKVTFGLNNLSTVQVGIAGPPLTGLVQWNKADAGVTVDVNNNVVTWSDQSGNGHDWSFGGGSIQPVTNAQNGLPVVRSSGTSSFLTTASYFSGTQQAEVFVVIKSNRPSSEVNYAWGGFGADAAVINHYPFFASTIYETFGHATRQGPIGVPNGGDATRTYGIYNVSAGTGAGGYVVRLDGTQLAAVTGSPGWHAGQFYLFSYWFNQTYQFLGDIGELLVYDHVLSTTDRADAYTYLQERWATPSNP